MWPITEYGSQSYLQGKPYYPYIGRGFVQLTWEDNYRKATQKLGLTGSDDLVKYPDRALDLVIATNVMFRGMAEGWFTGKRLDQYFNASKDDPVNARQIINGNDKDTLIAGYHQKFLTAVKAAKEAYFPPDPGPDPQPDAQVLVAITQPAGVKVTVSVNGEILA
jgi:putative chitinase